MPGKAHSYAKNIDKNQPQLVKALHDASGKQDKKHTTQSIGEWNVPDLLISAQDETNRLIEVKSDNDYLSEGQFEWHWQWGGQVTVARTVEEALQIAQAPQIISIKTACRITALMLGLRAYVDLKSYLFAYAASSKIKRKNQYDQPFEYPMTTWLKTTLEAFPQIFGYTAPEFWRFFVRALNEKRVTIPRLSDFEILTLETDFSAYRAAIEKTIQVNEQRDRIRKNLLEEYRKYELTGGMHLD